MSETCGEDLTAIILVTASIFWRKDVLPLLRLFRITVESRPLLSLTPETRGIPVNECN